MKKTVLLLSLTSLLIFSACSASSESISSNDIGLSASSEQKPKSKYREDIENILEKIDAIPNALVNRGQNEQASRKSLVDEEWLNNATEASEPSNEYKKFDFLTHLASAMYLSSYKSIIDHAKRNKDSLIRGCVYLNESFSQISRGTSVRIRIDSITGEYIFEILSLTSNTSTGGEDYFESFRCTTDENNKAKIKFEQYQKKLYTSIDYVEDDYIIYEEFFYNSNNTNQEYDDITKIMAYLDLKKECEMVSVTTHYKVYKETGEIEKLNSKDQITYVFKHENYYVLFMPNAVCGFEDYVEDSIRVYNSEFKEMYDMIYSDAIDYNLGSSPFTGLRVNIYEMVGGWDSIYYTKNFNDGLIALKIDGEIINYFDPGRVKCDKHIMDFNEGIAEEPMVFANYPDQLNDYLANYGLYLRSGVDFVKQYKDFKAIAKEKEMLGHDYDSIVNNDNAYNQYFAHEPKRFDEIVSEAKAFQGEIIPID